MEDREEQGAKANGQSGLSLLDEIAFDMILKGGKFSDRKKVKETVEVYPALLEEL